jgi:uncharacterized protein YbjQ (UPF0145 family)
MSELLDAMKALQGAGPSGRGTTSDLTIDETLLLHSIGWEPVDLVFGVSWWTIPLGAWQWQIGEIADASQAFAGAMRNAVSDLSKEVDKAGGSGVLGVEVEVRVRSRFVAVTLTGTAVRRVHHKEHRFEFASDLSARDFTLLSRAGWVPLGLAAGASFVVAPRRSARQWAQQQTQNVELPNLTEALYQAREGAMVRMDAMGRDLGADGIVAVKLREGPMGRGSRATQFVALGTAVKESPSGHQKINPSMVVSLNDAAVQFSASSLRS